jgi:hypothetical protein
MPLIGGRPGPDEQNAIGDAWFATGHAVSAKVGEAARASQSAAPRACRSLVLALSATVQVVILRLPIDCRRFPALQDRAWM